MKFVASIVALSVIVAAPGCGPQPERVTFSNGLAWRERPDSKYRFYTVAADTPAMNDIHILLPDDSVRALSQISKPMLEALNGGERRGDLMYAYHGDGDGGENVWCVTWPQHYHLFHPQRILLDRHDVPRQYILWFKDEKVAAMKANVGYAEPPDYTTWVPTFVRASTGQRYRMPLSERELRELFGPLTFPKR